MEKISLEFTEAELVAIRNALNYFGNGCSAGECSTLVGMQQEDVRALLERFLKRQHAKPAG